MFGRLFGDKSFYATLFRITVPIAVQQLLMSLLNAIDVVMIGQLGETSVAAVGLANQIYFLLALLLFGIGCGATIFAAQFWGRGDVRNIRRVLGISLLWGVAGSGLFTVLATLAPGWALGVYSKDPAVVAAGSGYLRLVGLSYVVTAITFIYSSVLRSTENVKLPMAVSVSALSLKTGLSYLLIFGHLGFPALGVMGAAIGTLVARYLECIILLALTYARPSPAAARPRELFALDAPFLRQFFKTTLPVVLAEVAWSLGMTTYNAVYARIGTESIAAVNIASTVENLAFVLFISMSNACAIMIGNKIGADEAEKAHVYAWRFLALGLIGALAVGVAILLSAETILSFFKISAMTHASARGVLTVMALVLWIKVSNLMMIVGILRSGGDTRFAFFVDAGSVWFVGVPLAFLGAFYFHLPVYWVVLLVIGDEAVKSVLSFRRVFSKRWVNNVVQYV
ncbi:MAG: MATE family efflux transporter [Chloroflexi bacterium HGW-Chloroflexi-1]|nr:MAG: MATE family efflux transporter [Chloroflexi bacterium HGW-Chloroflexi-1]